MTAEKSNAVEVLFLTGMHRSGTSLLAKNYVDLGTAFPGNLLPATDDNSEGYWEARECVILNNEIFSSVGQSWKSLEPISTDQWTYLRSGFVEATSACLDDLYNRAGRKAFALKDPRFCRLLPLWIEAAVELGMQPRLHATYRNAADVARSLYRRLRHPVFHPAALETPSDAHLLWLRYNVDLWCNSQSIDHQFTSFEALNGSIESIGLEPVEIARSQQGIVEGAPNICGEVEAAFEGNTEQTAERFERWKRLLDSNLRLDFEAPEQRITATSRASVLLRNHGSESKPVVSFVSGAPSSKGHIYRIENRIYALSGCEVIAQRASPVSTAAEDLAAVSDVIVIFRRPMDVWQSRLIEEANKRGVPIVFDIDDLVFDEDLIDPSIIRFLQNVDAASQNEWKFRAKQMRHALEAADQVWTTTDMLADQAKKFVSRVRCLPNGLSDHQLTQSRRYSRAPTTAHTIIGYASGTPSHDVDIEVVVPAISKILEQHPDVIFRCIGELDMSPLRAIDKRGYQVQHTPSVPYYDLSSVLSQFDISIAPLEWGNVFCDCKSELKFFEAGVVSVPSIITPTPPFVSCSDNGDAALLAQSSSDWETALRDLVQNKNERLRIGQAARRVSVERFGPERQRSDLLSCLRHILPSW